MCCLEGIYFEIPMSFKIFLAKLLSISFPLWNGTVYLLPFFSYRMWLPVCLLSTHPFREMMSCNSETFMTFLIVWHYKNR